MGWLQPISVSLLLSIPGNGKPETPNLSLGLISAHFPVEKGQISWRWEFFCLSPLWNHYLNYIYVIKVTYWDLIKIRKEGGNVPALGDASAWRPTSIGTRFFFFWDFFFLRNGTRSSKEEERWSHGLMALIGPGQSDLFLFFFSATRAAECVRNNVRGSKQAQPKSYWICC